MGKDTELFIKELKLPASRLRFYLIALISSISPFVAYNMFIQHFDTSWSDEEKQRIKDNCFWEFQRHFLKEATFFGCGVLILLIIACLLGNANWIFAIRSLAAILVLASISYDISQANKAHLGKFIHEIVAGKIRETYRVLAAFILLVVFATS